MCREFEIEPAKNEVLKPVLEWVNGTEMQVTTKLQFEHVFIVLTIKAIRIPVLLCYYVCISSRHIQAPRCEM